VKHVAIAVFSNGSNREQAEVEHATAPLGQHL
jgi:hypothetical protein